MRRPLLLAAVRSAVVQPILAMTVELPNVSATETQLHQTLRASEVGTGSAGPIKEAQEQCWPSLRTSHGTEESAGARMGDERKSLREGSGLSTVSARLYC